LSGWISQKEEQKKMAMTHAPRPKMGSPGVGRMGPIYMDAERARKYIGSTPHKPIVGKKTKTDREPMSTGEYKGHLRRIK
jgi:hypothetical protein